MLVSDNYTIQAGDNELVNVVTVGETPDTETTTVEDKADRSVEKTRIYFQGRCER